MKVTLAAALCATFAATAYAAPDSSNSAQESQAPQLVMAANITLPDAIRTVERKAGGHAISATYDVEHGNEGRYEIMVLTDDGQRVEKLDQNAYDGLVDAEWSAPAAEVYPTVSSRSLAQMPMSLESAIATALDKSGGRVTDATLENRHGSDRYAVTVARNDGSVETLEVGPNGSVERVAG
jgi:uncharacterized membrane protein YkoI